MKTNIHPLERIFRIGIGAALISMSFWGAFNPWFLLGAIPLLTGIVGWCPPYTLLGINTCKLGQR